jgi:hypothetical protein
MARISKSQKLADIHRKALTGFRATADVSRQERGMSLQDRRFASVAGAQYEGALGEQYANKPKLEVNKVGQALIALKGQYRQNRITVDFVPKQGGEADVTADMLDGLYRADEQDSGGQEAYTNAFDEMAAGGFGAWRIKAIEEDEEDDENEEQRLAFEPIHDADKSVYFDLGAKRVDKSDAQECWVLNPLPRKAYEETYDDNPANWPEEFTQYASDWCSPDVVVVCEYYIKVKEREVYQVWADPQGEEQELEAEDLAEVDDEGVSRLEMMQATGWRLLREKVKKCIYVDKYILSGGKVLSGPHRIPGKHIPIIPVFGIRSVIDGIERWKGLVRDAKDSQRLKNMQISDLALTASTGGRAKPIFTPAQMKGSPEEMWKNDGIANYNYLLVNPLVDPATGQVVSTGPIGYTQPAQVSPAAAALLQLTETDMQDVLGNSTNTEEIRSNVSADAVELVQAKHDTRSFIYLDGLAVAMRRCGEVWLSMAKEIYVEEGRVMKAVSEDGKTTSFTLKRPTMDRDGQKMVENDLASVKMDVIVDIGPSSASKRSATVRALTGMAQVAGDPETQSVLSSAALMNMDGEGLDDIRGFFRSKLVKMGVVKPSDKEAAELQAEAENAPPDANTAYLMAEAQKSQALTVKAAADTELVKAKTAETLAGITMEQRAQVLELARMLQSQQTPTMQ